MIHILEYPFEEELREEVGRRCQFKQFKYRTR